MDTMEVQTATVVGTARVDAWNQVQNFPTADGQSLALISLRYTGDREFVDLASIGSSLLENIRSKTYFESDLKLGDSDIVPAILVVNFHEATLSVEGVGDVELYILRGGRLGKIFVGSTARSSIDGKLEPNDVFLAATQEVVHAIGLKRIRQFMSMGILSAEDLAVQVHGTANSSLMAAAIMVATPTVGNHKLIVNANDQAKMSILTPIRDWARRMAHRLSLQKPLFIAPEKRAKNLWIGSTLLALLLVGIVVGAVRRSAIIKEQSYGLLSRNVTQKIAEARSIGDLNPERAKVLIKQSGEEIALYLSKNDVQSYVSRARELENSLKIAETEIFKKADISLTTLAEMKVVKKDLAPAAFAIDEKGIIYIADGQSSRIVGISTGDKSIFEYSTQNVGKAGEMGIYNKKIYTLVSDGVAVVSQDDNSLSIRPDDLWKDVQMLDVFAGNIYLLDKGQSEIWKYPAIKDGFGTRKRWLAPGIEPDLSSVVDMKVDGDVWLITSSGKLVRYSRGVPVSFAMEGLPSDNSILHDPRAVVATGQKVYVLERGEKRVVVFGEENGRYERQYANDEFGSAKDMAVYDGKVYLLFDDKIAWFGM